MSRNENSNEGSVWVVGYTSVDVLEFDAHSEWRAYLRFGGVCTNIARALGASNIKTTFFTPAYSCDLSRSLSQELLTHRVTQRYLEVSSPIALFKAAMDGDGDLSSADFHDFGAFEKTRPDALAPLTQETGSPAYLLSCTDLPSESIEYLSRFCSQRSIKFGLVATAPDEVVKLRALDVSIDFLSINKSELEAFLGESCDDIFSLTQAASRIVNTDGFALITMGAEGAVLFDGRSDRIILQKVPPLHFENLISAGDVLTAVIIGTTLTSISLDAALNQGTKKVLNYLHYDSEEYLTPFFSLRDSWKGFIPDVEVLGG